MDSVKLISSEEEGDVGYYIPIHIASSGCQQFNSVTWNTIQNTLINFDLVNQIYATAMRYAHPVKWFPLENMKRIIFKLIPFFEQHMLLRSSFAKRMPRLSL